MPLVASSLSHQRSRCFCLLVAHDFGLHPTLLPGRPGTSNALGSRHLEPSPVTCSECAIPSVQGSRRPTASLLRQLGSEFPTLSNPLHPKTCTTHGLAALQRGCAWQALTATPIPTPRATGQLTQAERWGWLPTPPIGAGAWEEHRGCRFPSQRINRSSSKERVSGPQEPALVSRHVCCGGGP